MDSKMHVLESLAVYAVNWIERIRVEYNVNSYVFLFLYIATLFPFYFSLYKIISCLRKKKADTMLYWIFVCLLTVVIPYAYILVFGRNISWVFWVLILLMVFLSIYLLFRKVKKMKIDRCVQSQENLMP